MASVTLRLNIRETERALQQFKARAPIAIARALNRSNLAVRTFMTKSIAADTKLKSATVKENLVMRDATPTKLKTQLSASLKRIPVMEFNARGPRPSYGRGRGVTAKTPAGRYPSAFIATMASGHTGVYQRVGQERLPIYELKGPSLGRVFEKFAAAGLDRGLESLVKNLQSELRFALSK